MEREPNVSETYPFELMVEIYEAGVGSRYVVSLHETALDAVAGLRYAAEELLQYYRSVDVRN